MSRKLYDVFGISVAIGLGVVIGVLLHLLGGLLHERKLCLEDNDRYDGYCVIEEDGFLEYHYYWYPATSTSVVPSTTHVEALQDTSAHNDSE